VGKGLRKKLLSYAGEYLVAARLSLMGYLVTITPKGAPEVDILVYDVERRRATTLQVKTVRQEGIHLGFKATKDNIDKVLNEKVSNPYVIVYIPNDDWSKAEFYVVPPNDIRELAKRMYFGWLDKIPHKKPREELEKTPQPLTISVRDLKHYKDEWDNIWRVK